MRRERTLEADSGVDHFLAPAFAKPDDFGRVVVLLDAGLHWFPVAQPHLPAVAVHQRGRDDRFADVGVGAGYEEAADHERLPGEIPLTTPAPTTAASARANVSMASSVSVTFTE